MHRCDRIDRGNLDAALGLLHNDVAREHRADLVFQTERFVRQRRITSAQDQVRAKLDADLVPKRLLDIDLADNAEAFALKRLSRTLHYI